MARSLVWSLCLGVAIVGSAAAFGLSRSASAFEPKNPAVRLAVEGRMDPSRLESDKSADFRPAPGSLTFNGFQLTPSVQEAAPTALAEVRPDPYLDQVGLADTSEQKQLQVEYALSAPARTTGFGVDVAVAPRAGLSLGPEGSQMRSVGGEVRLGKRLKNMLSPYDASAATFDRPSWYFFAATDGAALTWTPEAMAAGARHGLRYQEDRIVVGKAQVGLTMEARGMQASVGFTNREVSNGKESRDENFVGASFTMRH